MLVSPFCFDRTRHHEPPLECHSPRCRAAPLKLLLQPQRCCNRSTNLACNQLLARFRTAIQQQTLSIPLRSSLNTHVVGAKSVHLIHLMHSTSTSHKPHQATHAEYVTVTAGKSFRFFFSSELGLRYSMSEGRYHDRGRR